MTKESLKASWQHLKAELKAKHQQLTDADLHYVEGKEDDLYTRLQAKLGKNRIEVDQLLEHLHDGVKEKEGKFAKKH